MDAKIRESSMNHDVFISYSSRQSIIANQICQYLKNHGISVWMAPESIPPSSSYPKVINIAIRKCQICLLIFSNTASKSKWVKKEILQAINYDKPIIPFRIEDTTSSDDLDFLLVDTQSIDAFPIYKEQLPKLLDTIKGLLGGKRIDPPSIIQNLQSNMVYVEGGSFTMGGNPMKDEDAFDDEMPAHEVELSPFYIGKYAVTQEEWEYIMGDNPSIFKGEKRPVDNVSWDDCQAFIKKLNELTGKQFRLPTEAEWEFAARGGSRSRGYKYAGSDIIQDVAWYSDNSNAQTHDVGNKIPNELGLFDMSGNVFEWCQDWYGEYESRPTVNPLGASSGAYLINRGGSWNNQAYNCRVSDRLYDISSYRDNCSGFRLAHDK